MDQQVNSRLSPIVRGLLAVVVLILILGGFGLFFGVPDLARVRWPWGLTPFNTRFLGAVYLGELMGAGALLIVNRWSPARMALVTGGVFTLLVSLVTVVHLERFDLDQRAPALWVILYVGSTLLIGIYLWVNRTRPFADRAPNPPIWRGYLQLQALVIGLYGGLMLVAPRLATDFWPWPIDAFHGRLYSGVFIAGSVGAWLLARITTRAEWLTLGLTQLVFGAFTILGLILVDVDTNRVDWAAIGTWLFLFPFTWIGAAGAVMVGYGLQLAEAEATASDVALAR